MAYLRHPFVYGFMLLWPLYC